MVSQITHSFAFFSCSEKTDDQTIDDKFQKFWELESIPHQTYLTSEEQQAEEHFVQTHRRDTTGRFIVRLPTKSPFNQLGESRPQALKRFHYLERKLNNNNDLKVEYTKFMTEYLQLCPMIEINEDHDPATRINYYLPHHAVIKPSSSTTQTRVVFDASASTTSGFSLNDMLMVGPTIQQDLFSIMIRSRKYKLMFTADIPKMYRQINVDRRDTLLQRILWRNNPSEQVKTYELTTVTYGTAAAPFLATRALHQLALDERQQYPTAAEIILSLFAVIYWKLVLKSELKLGGFIWCFYTPSHLSHKDYQYEPEAAAQYAAVAPLFWTLGISWIIFACCTDQSWNLLYLLHFHLFVFPICRIISHCITEPGIIFFFFIVKI